MQDVAWQGDEDISKMEFGTFSSLLSVNGKTKGNPCLVFIKLCVE